MPIDLGIDERDGTSKPDLGDTNNNSGAHHARASTADTSHTDGSSTPDVVSLGSLFLFFGHKIKNGTGCIDMLHTQHSLAREGTQSVVTSPRDERLPIVVLNDVINGRQPGNLISLIMRPSFSQTVFFSYLSGGRGTQSPRIYVGNQPGRLLLIITEGSLSLSMAERNGYNPLSIVRGARR